MMERVGIFGGSFDPIHYGHLAMAEAVRECLLLQRVLFLPTGQQPLKGAHRGQAAQRFEMVQLAIADHAAFEASALEVKRAGPSYSVDSVRVLQQEQSAKQWWFIVGADAFASLPAWHQVEQLAGLTRFAVVGRPGYRVDAQSLAAHVPGLAWDWCAAPLLDITATLIRERVMAGRSIRYLVPERVRSYIEDHGLYRV